MEAPIWRLAYIELVRPFAYFWFSYCLKIIWWNSLHLILVLLKWEKRSPSSIDKKNLCLKGFSATVLYFVIGNTLMALSDIGKMINLTMAGQFLIHAKAAARIQLQRMQVTFNCCKHIHTDDTRKILYASWHKIKYFIILSKMTHFKAMSDHERYQCDCLVDQVNLMYFT